MIRVVIVDDHAILRRGLSQIIAESGDMEVVGEAEASAPALALYRRAGFEPAAVWRTRVSRHLP